MNWFDRWVAKKIRESQQKESAGYALSHNEIKALTVNSAIVGQKISADRMDSNPDLNFKMYRAENGYIMEVRQYDKRTDRHTNNLHLIPDGNDLGNSIAQIITIESLKVS